MAEKTEAVVSAEQSAAKLVDGVVTINDLTSEYVSGCRVFTHYNGPTDYLGGMCTGMAVLDPGATPHPPHRHPEEEFMIVTEGTGEIECDGKTTQVGPGAVIDALHSVVARTASMLAVVQLDDLLGEIEPVNIPGTYREYPNWRRKLALPVEERHVERCGERADRVDHQLGKRLLHFRALDLQHGRLGARPLPARLAADDAQHRHLERHQLEDRLVGERRPARPRLTLAAVDRAGEQPARRPARRRARQLLLLVDAAEGVASTGDRATDRAP